MTTYRIMTFNLKNDMPFTRKYLKWNVRKELAITLLQSVSPDILGVQELTDEMLGSFVTFKQIYTNVGKPRNKRPKKTSERTDIFYRRDKFICIETKTFWLSRTPENEGSKLLFSIFPRICTMVKLQNKENNEILNIYNTHLDHLMESTRKKECEILLDHINQNSKNEHVIVMGDMNSTNMSASVKSLLENNRIPLQSIYQSENIFNTLHYGSGKLNENKKPIDYIFTTYNFEIKDSKIITQNFDGIYPSDHYPVVCELIYK